ncbi:hypothetical protein [uncultured Microbacterium sp.]|uniref:hypothetical protein n=1 Tax=uncultured Microbacterium sp. TaxID=191216 RepID=UPI002624997E|nr:hypothetical protein [uncultured Microbacterium sp.]
MGAFGWIEWVFWAAIAVGVIVRLVVVLRRRGRRGREALRSAFGPVVDAGAVQSAAYGWTPSSSTDLPAAYGTVQTGEVDDRPRDLPERRA